MTISYSNLKFGWKIINLNPDYLVFDSTTFQVPFLGMTNTKLANNDFGLLGLVKISFSKCLITAFFSTTDIIVQFKKY